MGKPKVGDKLFIVEILHGRIPTSSCPCEVAKVGRKYFTVVYFHSSYPSDLLREQFLCETWKQKLTGYGCGESCRLYRTQQEVEDDKETLRLHAILREAISSAYFPIYSLEQYREVCEVLELNSVMISKKAESLL